MGVLLVVEDDVRLPDFVYRQPEALDAAKIRVVPGEVGVSPDLGEPTVHGEHLVLLVDIDDVVDGHVEGDVDRSRGVLGRTHARLVVAQQVLGQPVLVLSTHHHWQT